MLVSSLTGKLGMPFTTICTHGIQFEMWAQGTRFTNLILPALELSQLTNYLISSLIRKH